MTSDVSEHGVQGREPGRRAVTGGMSPADQRSTAADVPELDDAYASYYGQPVVRRPGWREADIVGYLFVGGLAGGSSVLAAGSALAGADVAARRMRLTAAAGSFASIGLLVHDLGRPARFLNMLRVLKPTSPMNVGSWLLGAYVPAAVVSAIGDGAGVLRPLVRPATWSAAVLGSAMTAYTGVLLADTAIPAWHEAGDELPFLFAGSSAAAAGGVGMIVAPSLESGPARRFGIAGAAIELIAEALVRRRAGLIRPAHERGTAGRLSRTGRALAIAGIAMAVMGRRRPRLRRIGGACLTASSAVSRMAIFRAGLGSADDPRFVIEPQRRRGDLRSGVSAG